jgi:hypothetical protein
MPPGRRQPQRLTHDSSERNQVERLFERALAQLGWLDVKP